MIPWPVVFMPDNSEVEKVIEVALLSLVTTLLPSEITQSMLSTPEGTDWMESVTELEILIVSL